MTDTLGHITLDGNDLFIAPSSKDAALTLERNLDDASVDFRFINPLTGRGRIPVALHGSLPDTDILGVIHIAPHRQICGTSKYETLKKLADSGELTFETFQQVLREFRPEISPAKYYHHQDDTKATLERLGINQKTGGKGVGS